MKKILIFVLMIFMLFAQTFGETIGETTGETTLKKDKEEPGPYGKYDQYNRVFVDTSSA